MENAKESCGGEKPTEENPIPTTQTETVTLPDPPSRQRTPFTSLSQVDADLALVRTRQEQERAYMMLRMSRGDGSEFGSSESESFVDEEELVHLNGEGDAESDGGEDAFDVHARADIEDVLDAEIDPSAFDSDEAYARALQEAHDWEVARALQEAHDWEVARALQEAHDWEVAARFVGINNWESVDSEDEVSNSQKLMALSGEDAFDVHVRAAIKDVSDAEIDPLVLNSNKAYARTLQEAHDRELAVRLTELVGINYPKAEDPEDEGSDSQ